MTLSWMIDKGCPADILVNDAKGSVTSGRGARAEYILERW